MSTIEDLKLRHDIKRSIRKSKSATKISMAKIKGDNKVSQELISKKFESTLKRKLKQSYESSNLKKTFNNYIDLDVLASANLIKDSTKKVKVFLDTQESAKLKLKGIKTTVSVRKILEEAGGSVE